MDNINAPSGGNAPQSDQSPQGGQPPGGQSQPGGGPPDQDNPPAGGPPAGGPPQDAGQDQSAGGADSLKMPPQVGGGEGAGPPAEAPPNQEGGAPEPQEAQAPPAGEGPVEDVLEGAEGPAPDQAGPLSGPEPGGMGEAPSEEMPTQGDMGPASPGSVPQDAGAPEQGMPPGEMSQGEVAPQSQPDFTGPGGQVPSGAQPPKPGGSKVMPILLIILILIIGGVALAYFMNWISLPFLDSLLGREQPTEEVAPVEEGAEVNPYPEDVQRKSDLAQIKAALEKYFETNQKYPIAKELENSSESTSAIYTALVPDHLETMPTDPSSPSKYYGYESADGTSFELSAILDNPDDTEGVKRGDLNLYILTNVSEVENQPTEAEET